MYTQIQPQTCVHTHIHTHTCITILYMREKSTGVKVKPSHQTRIQGFQLSDSHAVLVAVPQAAAADEMQTQHEQEKQQRAFHFCLDNSASMSRNSEIAKNMFAQLLGEGAPSSPSSPSTKVQSSFTIFSERATTLSKSLTTAAEMERIQLPSQGMTNIAAGVEHSVDCIIDAERQQERKSWRRGAAAASAEKIRTHHVLILLTDGANNAGQ